MTDSEKQFVALVSMIAAAALGAGKLLVGLMTGSLGLLSEAAHSGLDFIASVMTFFAVRISDRPADHEHTYGHGKIENLSALLESALLLGACGWIVYEAVRRILAHTAVVEANAWAFGVIIASIVIDSWRSAALRRAAKKYKSQALEADALNFTTDLVTSSVVLIGLGLVKYGEYIGQPERFEHADAIAALVVTGLLMTVTVRLAKRAIDVLMDRAPYEIQVAVEKAARGVKGVIGVHQIRVRPSGSRMFIDLHVCVARTTGLEPSHRIAEAVERAVENSVENANVMVHIDPRPDEEERLADRVRIVAANLGVPVHSLHFNRQGTKLHLELDLEVDSLRPDGSPLSLNEAHAVSKRLEQALRKEIPEIHHVHTHIEPRRLEVEPTHSITPDSELIRQVREIVRTMPGVVDCHAVEIERIGQAEFVVTLHCTFARGAGIEEAHRTATMIEEALKAKYPGFRRVHVHTEPSTRKDS